MADSAPNPNSKRRRGLGIVTPNACTECRKKRAKCDGQTPCGRCTSQKVECVYETPVRQSKDDMRSEIEQLKNANQQTQRILAAVASSDGISQDILMQLRNGATLEQITAQLEKADSRTDRQNITTFTNFNDHQAIGNALRPATDMKGLPGAPRGTSLEFKASQSQYAGNAFSPWSSEGAAHSSRSGSHQDDHMNWTPGIMTQNNPPGRTPLVGQWHQQDAAQSESPADSSIRYAQDSGQEMILGSDFGMNDGPNQPGGTWTDVTSDLSLVEHLMALYFCWEYPTFASLNKEHFLEGFKTGNNRFCSSLLVNTILALGCRFSNQPKARSDPENSNTAGDHFFAEALKLLEREPERHILTTVQALGLMAIREASCGRSSESLYFSGQSIRLAIEMGLHYEPTGKDGDEHSVRSATFWGAFSLDQAWSLSIGRLPHFSRDLRLVTKPAIIDSVEAADWVPYTDDGAPFERSCTQPSNIRSVFKTFCELSEIVHFTLYTLYSPGTKLTGQRLLACYTKYLSWYDSIPTALRLGQNFTPAVLFAHMYYHFAILLLFRPFIKLEIIGSEISPRDVCAQAASAISTLVNSYSKLYTLRRTPSFVPYFVLTSCIAHVVTLGSADPPSPEQLHQGVSDLLEMKDCHGFANRALDILHYLLHHWEIDHVIEKGREIEEITELCRPVSTGINMFCTHLESGDIGSGPKTAKEGENPLFWPFPLQGRPLLDVGSKLEEAGFKVLPS